MGDAMQSFLYGICALAICAGVIWLCSRVKALCRKYLERRESHDDK